MLNTVALLIPVFLLVVAIEWYVSYKRGDKKYTTGNTIMNLAIGAIDQIGSICHFALLYLVMQFVYNHFRIIDISNVWFQWIAGYIAVDFLSYWYHRWSHRVNILWAGHITHHSSPLFNLSNGFRTSFFQGFYRVAFWAVLPVFGFSPLILVIILKISGIYDFLLHTEYIPRLGFLEKILITPSSHRVHHGKNDIYIDKNYGSTFIVWDKLFGTYQQETEPVVYGIKSPYIDNNPLSAIGHHYQYLWKTITSTTHWFDKVKLLFMPPEWKPQNIVSPHHFFSGNKFKVSFSLKQYAYFQLACCTIGTIVLLVYKNFISNWEFIFCSVLAVSTLTNVALIINESINERFAKQEFIRLICGLLIAILMVIVYSKFYLLFIIVYLTISILFATFKWRRKPITLDLQKDQYFLKG